MELIILSTGFDWNISTILGGMFLLLISTSIGAWFKHIFDKIKSREQDVKAKEKELEEIEEEKRIIKEQEGLKRKAEFEVLINAITDSDKKQDIKLNHLQEQIDGIKKNLKEGLEKVNVHLKRDDEKNELKRILKKESSKLIKVNPDLKSNPNFSGMVTLLNAGRDATIELGIHVFFSNKEDITKTNLEDDVWSIFDNLKAVAKNNISDEFSKSLRNNTKIKVYAESLILNLYNLKHENYNGDTFKILKSVLTDFMEKVSLDAIQYWREIKTIKEFIN